LHTTAVPLDLVCWVAEVQKGFDVSGRLSTPHPVAIHHQRLCFTKLPEAIELSRPKFAFHNFSD